MAKRVTESIINNTFWPWSRKYSATAMATNAPLSRAMAGWLDVATTTTDLLPARLVQVFLQKFAHFASAFADQRDDVDIGLRLAGDHAQQGGFAHAAAGENPQALPAPARDEGVDGFDAGAKAMRDPLALERMRRLQIQTDVIGSPSIGPKSSSGCPKSVNHPAHQARRPPARAERSPAR